jgi:hypothetical protein
MPVLSLTAVSVRYHSSDRHQGLPSADVQLEQRRGEYQDSYVADHARSAAEADVSVAAESARGRACETCPANRAVLD